MLPVSVQGVIIPGLENVMLYIYCSFSLFQISYFKCLQRISSLCPCYIWCTMCFWHGCKFLFCYFGAGSYWREGLAAFYQFELLSLHLISNTHKYSGLNKVIHLTKRVKDWNHNMPECRQGQGDSIHNVEVDLVWFIFKNTLIL